MESLWSDCYGSLKALASHRLRAAGQFTLLDTTGLVHESYLKLLQTGRAGLSPANRAQFLAHASSVMRSVIVDLARQRLAAKRGGGEVLRLDTQMSEDASDPALADDDPLFVANALDILREREPRLAQVVEMRFFGGLTEPEIAEALEISERTVRNDWSKARVLMRMLLG